MGGDRAPCTAEALGFELENGIPGEMACVRYARSISIAPMMVWPFIKVFYRIPW